MGFTARKSFKAMPGVALTISHAAPVEPAVQLTPIGKPGVMAPRWEKELHAVLLDGRFEELVAFGSAYPAVASLVTCLDALTAITTGDSALALPLLWRAWGSGEQVEREPFVRTYLGSSTVTFGVAAGVTATLPLSRDAVGLALVGLERAEDDPDEAIRVAETLDPSAVAAVTLAELYLESSRWRDVVTLTDGVTNVDDPTALLLTWRGAALRELGLVTPAHDALKEALKVRSRDAIVQQRAMVERAKCYIDEGNAAAARRDLIRLMTKDPAHPGIQELLDLTLVISQIRPES
jgi:tetratricopeptide (TPR) repeat protein